MTRAPAVAAPDALASEADFLALVTDLADLCGWLWYHTHRSDRSPSGFPDLVMVRNRLVVAELKRAGEKPTADQRGWLGALRLVGVEAYLWRPRDWPEILHTLADGGPVTIDG